MDIWLKLTVDKNVIYNTKTIFMLEIILHDDHGIAKIYMLGKNKLKFIHHQ